MKIHTLGMAGTLESSDVTIRVEPYDNGIDIELKSQVATQFGDHIKQFVSSTLASLDIKNAKVTIDDKGALDCIIKARLLTAIQRSTPEFTYDWSKEVFNEA